jgi:cytochrome c oxidase subunit 3/cytochrome o ubiquinol oxidase subunit 3
MSAAAASHPSQEGAAWSRGQVGTLSLILAETSFFAVFLVAYLFYIGKSATGPQPADVLDTPWLASVCLLSSSATIVVASRALARGAIARFTLFLGVTIALGGTFLFLTGLEWHSLIVGHGLTLTTNLFGTTYYSLVGFHAAHVAIGLLLMTLVLVLSLRGHVAARYAERVEMLSWYWHFVDVVWIFVFTVVYVVGV